MNGGEREDVMRKGRQGAKDDNQKRKVGAKYDRRGSGGWNVSMVRGKK